MKAEYRAIQKLRRSMEVLGSHLDGLREKANKAYEVGNHEQYEAYAEHIAYCEDRMLQLIGAVGTLVERVHEAYTR